MHCIYSRMAIGEERGELIYDETFVSAHASKRAVEMTIKIDYSDSERYDGEVEFVHGEREFAFCITMISPGKRLTAKVAKGDILVVTPKSATLNMEDMDHDEVMGKIKETAKNLGRKLKVGDWVKI